MACGGDLGRITVDMMDASWKGNVGLVTTLLSDLRPAPDTAALCGPTMMINAVAEDLVRRGFPSSRNWVVGESH